jgi:hypothetical protein
VIVQPDNEEFRNDVIAAALAEVPELCQEFGCRQPVQTWCPLCRCFFCDEHDELYPRRRHWCLKGPAEE